eukprot:4590679-Pyramimonas_sp.AAC.1
MASRPGPVAHRRCLGSKAARASSRMDRTAPGAAAGDANDHGASCSNHLNACLMPSCLVASLDHSIQLRRR